MASASVEYDTVDIKDFKDVFEEPEGESSLESPSPSPNSRTERHAELLKLFKLPATECLVDDFICALRRRVLYQGRMYVFDHFACFHSHIFNYRKILVIPLKDVTQIRKKKMYGFPNSIEIVYKGRPESFASFLRRETAHRLLMYTWSKSTPYAKLFGGVSEGTDPPSPRGQYTSDSRKGQVLAKISKLVHRRGDSNSQGKIASSAQGDDLSSDADDEKTLNSSRDVLEAESVSEVLSRLSDSDDEEAESGGLEAWVPTAEEPQPPDPTMVLLTESEFELSVREFFKEFLSEQSQFLITWHESRGDTKVQLGEWHKHAVGHVRELTFITPLKQKIGPSKCLCTQTQRARLHAGNQLLFETSQIMDIPYGDHFSVEVRWDIKPAAKDKKCKVEVRLAIPFSKRTFVLTTIESSTRALMKDASEDWIATAQRWLEPPIPIRSVFQGQDSSSGDDYQEATHLSRAQSLTVRLSTDRVPDMDLLLRAPSPHRSDIARMLALQRRETERKLGSPFGGDSGSRLKSVTFEEPGQPGRGRAGKKWAALAILGTAVAVMLVAGAWLIIRGALLTLGQWKLGWAELLGPQHTMFWSKWSSDPGMDVRSLAEQVELLQHGLAELREQVQMLTSQNCARE